MGEWVGGGGQLSFIKRGELLGVRVIMPHNSVPGYTHTLHFLIPGSAPVILSSLECLLMSSLYNGIID